MNKNLQQVIGFRDLLSHVTLINFNESHTKQTSMYKL